MPQLDTSTYSSQLFWLFTSFSILFFILKLKIIPLFDDLRQKRWDNIDGTKQVAERFVKEGEEINKEWKRLLEDAKKKSSDILSESDNRAKLYFYDGKMKFLDSIQDRLSKTKVLLRNQELEIEQNILDGIIPVTVDIIIKSSNNVLSKNKVEIYLRNNLSSIKKTLKFRSENV